MSAPGRLSADLLQWKDIQEGFKNGRILALGGIIFADRRLCFAGISHFVGQSSIFTLTDQRATGEAYCLAHHVTVDGEKRRLMLASLRYLDTFVKMDGVWLFAERRLYVDWLEERALS